jgi:hypothetical protein
VNSLPDTNEMLATLDALREAVRAGVASEAKLNTDFSAQSRAAAAALEAQTQKNLAWLSDAGDDAEVEREEFVATSHTKFAVRKDRINRAHIAVRNRVVNGATNNEGRAKHRAQTGALEAKRRHEDGKLAATNAWAEFSARLSESRDTHAQLETDARKALPRAGKLASFTPDAALDEQQLFAAAQELMAKSRAQLDAFKKTFAASLVGSLFNRSASAPVAAEIHAALAKSKLLLDAAETLALAQHDAEQARVLAEWTQTDAALNEQWRAAVQAGISDRANLPHSVDKKAARIHQRNETILQTRLQRAETTQAETLAAARRNHAAADRELAASHAAKLAQLEAQNLAAWATLEKSWRETVPPLLAQIAAATDAAAEGFPAWDATLLQVWTPPLHFKNVAPFARLEVEWETFVGSLPKDERLTLHGESSRPGCSSARPRAEHARTETDAGARPAAPGAGALPEQIPGKLSAPLALAFPRLGSILFETNGAGGDEACAAINNLIFRLLATTPPGKLNFTIFDPVGLGQNFAGLMHLADYEAGQINSRIWTQQNQFEEKLAELSEHMEKVIQMYLRNEYATITEYNAQAGSIAEKYHILVVASFPVNFSDTAARRLRNIAASGARCGVFTFIHWDQRNAAPPDFVPDELRKNSVRLVRGERGFELAHGKFPGARLRLDAPPSPEFATEFLKQVGARGRGANRVEVPFSQIAPPDAQLWSETTTSELRVPIGRSGATKLQYLAIGRDTRQHALIAGKTGSGKSTLFHVIITNLALWCSPDEVEFYLVDFKKGVEFKCYASRQLPHARVVAIESDRAFGLSVLQRIDDELRRRGDLFRKVGAQDLAGYKRANGTEKIPRTLLIIDEFQEFFTEEDRVSQGAAVLLDRIVRQGRAFGIHVLLGSQTLGGAYTLARATIGQMVIRIALQCNEADAYLIMDQDNPAPRLLTRPGEGIYNDTAGSIEGNSPFQAVWLADTVRDNYLQQVRARAGAATEKYPGPFVFEGNAPADVRENVLLNGLLKSPGKKSGDTTNVWLGAPNSIKGPTEARFQRQSGSNLLVVGQNDEATLTMLAVSLVSLAAQFPVGAAKFVLLDSTAPGSSERNYLDAVVAALPHEITRVSGGDVGEAMASLGEELKQRSDDVHTANAPEVFVFVHGLHNFKKLRQEDEFSFSSASDGGVSAAAVFLDLLKEGAARGVHVLASCDSYNNANRALGRKNLSEFEARVLFQMSASDSASLIDAPDAATLGLHRALLYNDREGFTEIFRPYAKPGGDWLETVARAFQS